MFIKIVFNEEVRIHRVHLTNLIDLTNFIAQTYPDAPTHLQLTYTDLDGDEITIASEEDIQTIQELYQGAKSIKICLKESVRHLREQKEFQILTDDVNNHLNLDEASKNQKKKVKKDKFNKKVKAALAEMLPDLTNKEEQTVHDRVECDSCHQNPIQGARFKCSECENFDLCSKCEAKSHHPHAFLKINHPAQNSDIIPPKRSPPPYNFWWRDTFRFQRKNLATIPELFDEIQVTGREGQARENQEREIQRQREIEKQIESEIQREREKEKEKLKEQKKEKENEQNQNKNLVEIKENEQKDQNQEMEQDESEKKTQRLIEIFPELDQENIRRIVQTNSFLSIDEIANLLVS